MSIAIPTNKAAIIRWAKAQEPQLTVEQLAKRFDASPAVVKTALAWKGNLATRGRRA